MGLVTGIANLLEILSAYLQSAHAELIVLRIIIISKFALIYIFITYWMV